MEFNNWINKAFHQITLSKFPEQAHQWGIMTYLGLKLMLCQEDNSTSAIDDGKWEKVMYMCVCSIRLLLIFSFMRLSYIDIYNWMC